MNRIGFHYFQDTDHYRKSDLNAWLPILDRLKSRWMVLAAPKDRAIPEPFLEGLLDNQVEPVLQFNLTPDALPKAEDLHFLLEIYAKWGVRYISLFQKPNMRSQWKTTNWARIDLVERFLDIYLPLAETCLACGLIPVFPPLEPGGDYWDTVFLRASLQGIKRRGHKYLLQKLVIGAIAKTGGKPLNWGTGGPERWPEAQPYNTSEKEDHRGFRIFDWYDALIQSVLVEARPIFLFGVDPSASDDPEYQTYTNDSLLIAHLLEGKTVESLDPIPDTVLGAAFWLLSAPQGTPEYPNAWFRTGDENLPVVAELENWASAQVEVSSETENAQPETHPITHYLLLPTYDNEISDRHLEIIRPYIKHYKPTIGFSPEEALGAERVYIIGEPNAYPDETIRMLRNAGCIVQIIDDMAQQLHPEFQVNNT